jgi:DNA-binding NarL/FixJ family response regulator
MIVGRSDVLAALDQAVLAAEGGHHTSLLIVGTPGMGATTVLEHACETARGRGWRVATAGAAPEAASVPTTLVRDLLHELELSSRDSQSEQAAASAAPPPSPQQQIGWLATRLRDLVAESARTQPVLLAVDDLHQTDEASIGALTLATGRLSGTRSLVVGTSQPPVDDERLESWQRLDLPALRERDATTLLRRHTTPALPSHRARTVAAALGYCPAAIVECTRLLSPAELTGAAPLPQPVPVGSRLTLGWRRTVAALSPQTRRALLAVAVLGLDDPPLLHDVLARVGCTTDDLAAARDAGVLVEEDGHAPRIVSPTAQAAVLASHSAPTVRSVHRTVAQAAAQLRRTPAIVIRHLTQAASSADEWLAAQLDHQARRASSTDLPDVAARGWLAAAQLTPDEQLRADRAVEAARVWLSESTSVSAPDELLDVLTAAPLRSKEVLWREWLRSEVLAGRDLGQAAASGLAAAKHAAVDAPSLAPWLFWNATALAWMAGEPDLAVESADLLHQWARHRFAGQDGLPPDWVGDAVRGTALLLRGDTDAGVADVARARRRAAAWRSGPTTSQSALMAVVALDELLLVDSTAAQERVQELSARVAPDEGAMRAALGVVLAGRARRTGRWHAARAMAEQAQTWALAVHAPTEQRAASALLVELAAVCASDDEFTGLLTELRSRASTVGDRQVLASCDYAEGTRAMARDDLDTAVVVLSRLNDCPLWGRSCTDAPMAGRIDLVETCVLQAEPRSARSVAHALLPRLAALPPIDPCAPVVLRRVEALLAPAEQAEDLFRTAVSTSSGYDSEALAHTRTAFGRLLSSLGRADAARRELRQAHATYRRLGARVWQDAIDRLLDGAQRPRRRPFDALTPQERRVADAVASGATNQQVADELVLSVRTVEYHLGNVYRKLGVHRRSELARLAWATAHNGSDEISASAHTHSRTALPST